MRKKIWLLSVALLILAMLTGCDSSKYKEATELFNAGNYAEARAMFVELGDYEDSEVKVKECDYQMAEELLANKKFEEARELYLSLSDFQDCEEKAKECLYQLAMSKIYINDKSVPIEMLAQIPGYKDADAYVQGYRILQSYAGTYYCEPSLEVLLSEDYEYHLFEIEFEISKTFRSIEQIGDDRYKVVFDITINDYILHKDGITHNVGGGLTFEGFFDYVVGIDEPNRILVFKDNIGWMSGTGGIVYNFCYDGNVHPILTFAPMDEQDKLIIPEVRDYSCYKIN